MIKTRTSPMCISLAGLLLIFAALIACGAESGDMAPSAPQRAAMPMQESADTAGNTGLPGNSGGIMAARAAPAAVAPALAPAPAPAPAPAATAAPIAVSQKAAETVNLEADESSEMAEFGDAQASLVAQNRIIVRTVNLSLEVSGVADSIEEISQRAQQEGGWVVSTDRSSKHTGFVSVRVPAKNLDASLQWMRQVGLDVLSEASTSTDVTDEY